MSKTTPAPEPPANVGDTARPSWTRQHKRELTFGTVIALAGLVMAWQQLAFSDRQQRYQQAVFTITEIVGKWNDSTGALKDRIEARYPGAYNDPGGSAAFEAAAVALVDATTDDPVASILPVCPVPTPSGRAPRHPAVGRGVAFGDQFGSSSLTNASA